jgi:hypothetical protein
MNGSPSGIVKPATLVPRITPAVGMPPKQA